MNFAPLKVLIPSRGMLFVLIGIGLALGWYFNNAERTANHLVKRNFNYLNQVAVNLNASAEAARAAVPFNSSYVRDCVGKKFVDLFNRDEYIEDKAALRISAEICMGELKSRLVEQGALVSTSEDVAASYAQQRAPAPFDRLVSRNVCIGADIEGNNARQHLLVSSFRESLVNIVPDGVLNRYNMYLAVAKNAPEGIKCGDKLGQQVPAHDGHLIATIVMTIPYQNISGMDSTESFFDTLLIAKSDGEKSSVLFSNTEAPLKIDKHDIDALFRARSGFERFVNIREFELQNGVLHGPLGPTGKPLGETGEPMQFTQSALVPVTIGGFSQLAFVQPIRSEHTDQPGLVLIGIVGNSAFNKLKYAVPYNWISNAFLLLIVGVLSLNFFRLKLIRERGVIHRSDTILACISLLGIASLVVVFAVHLTGSGEFNKMFDRDLKTLQEGITKEFRTELAEKVGLISRGGDGLSRGCKPKLTIDTEQNELAKDGPESEDNCGEQKPSFFNKQYSLKTKGVPPVSTMFILDAQGRQSMGYMTHSRSAPPLGFSVGSREYFRVINGGGGWYWSEKTDEGTLKYTRFFMQRIESKATGSMETAISMPIKLDKNDGVVVGLAKLQSLEQTVLPLGFGFAVFDRNTGMVLYHSNPKRNLRENFYRATDDDSALKAAIIAGVPMDLNLNYKGQKIDAVVSPLDHTQWNLVVYHLDSIVDVVNFHFGITALMLAGSYILIWLVGLPLVVVVGFWLFRLAFVERLHRRDYTSLPPQWLYPVAELLPQYRQLALWLLVLCLAYIPIISWWDLPNVRYWVMLTLLLVPLLWVYFLRRGENWTQAIGGAKNTVFDRPLTDDEKHKRRHILVRTYGWYRFNACLAVLLLAVLPTMLLHNENYDVHEKLWVEYANWTVVDRLKARAHARRRYLAGLEIDEASPETDKWRGVYLPRTCIYTAQGGKHLSDAGLLAGVSICRPLDRNAQPPSHYKEDSLYIEVIDSSGKTIDGATSGLDPGEKATRNGSGQSEYMSSLMGFLPNIDDQGLLLESFVKTNKQESALGDSSPDTGGGPHEGRSLQSILPDLDSQLVYVLRSFFPHTRPIKWWGIMLFYTSLALLSGIVTSGLHGFLLRTFLSRDFEEALPEIARKFTLADLRDGGVIVYPAGVGVKAAFAQFTADMDLFAKEYSDDRAGVDLWGVRDVALVESENLLIIKDFFASVKDRTASAKLMDLIRRKRQEGFSTVILTDIDLDHWVYHRLHAEDMPEQEFHRWEAMITSLPTFMLPLWHDGRPQTASYQLPKRSYRRTWQHCSEDERMVLAGLRYESVVNPRNSYTLRSLYRRRLIEFRNGHFEFGDNDWYQFVGGQMHRAEFRNLAHRYKNNVWRAFRGPMLLILLVLVLFLAYVAQDQMKFAFTILGTVGAGAASLTTLGNKLRGLRGLASE
jgi:hypothetical protein